VWLFSEYLLQLDPIESPVSERYVRVIALRGPSYQSAVQGSTKSHCCTSEMKGNGLVQQVCALRFALVKSYDSETRHSDSDRLFAPPQVPTSLPRLEPMVK